AAADATHFTPRLLPELGLRSYRLEVNTVGDAKCRPKIAETLATYFTANRDALSAESRKRLETNPPRILDSKDPKDRAVVSAAPPLHELLSAEDRQAFH